MEAVDMRPIPNFTGYLAGADGEIYSTLRHHNSQSPPTLPRRMRSRFDGAKYKRITLMVDGVKGTQRVHRLVCMAFHGPQPLGMECCHGPAGRSDNRPENLSWGTHIKNQNEDRRRDGTQLYGEKIPSAKLNAEKVRQISRLLAVGETRRAIAEKFGVAYNTIHAMTSGRTWAHVPREPLEED